LDKTLLLEVHKIVEHGTFVSWGKVGGMLWFKHLQPMFKGCLFNWEYGTKWMFVGEIGMIGDQ